MKRNTIDHPKMRRLARRVGGRAQAVGILECLWHWAARYAIQGDVGRWPDEDIAEAVYWDGDPEEIVQHLIECGWVDEDATHRLVIHDWEDHADESVRKTLKNRGLEWAESEEAPNGREGNATFRESSRKVSPARARACARAGAIAVAGAQDAGSNGSSAGADSPCCETSELDAGVDGRDGPNKAAEYRLVLKNGAEYVPPPEKLEEWRLAYPELDLDRALRKACQYMRDNPHKRVTRKYAASWLGKWFNRERDGPPWSKSGANGKQVVNRSVKQEFEHGDPLVE